MNQRDEETDLDLLHRAFDEEWGKSWDEFSTDYRNVLSKLGNEFFSLPEKLIEIISDEIPKFFSADDKQFELRLVRLVGSGKFLGQTISHPSLPERDFTEREAQLLQQIETHPMQVEIDRRLRYGRNEGQSPALIASIRNKEQSQQAEVARRLSAYVGWLVTDPNFRLDRECFLRDWRETIIARGKFPEIPRSFFNENPKPPAKEDHDFYASFMIFYRKWGLRTFASWELPVPIEPTLHLPAIDHIPSLGGAGLQVFIPWYLLRDKSISLTDIVDLKRGSTPLKHLDDWLDGKPKNWGYDRFALMAKIHVYLNCVLLDRYPDKAKRNIGRLDHAFGAYFTANKDVDDVAIKGAENVRKIRQELKRRLAVIPGK